jgi:hypothetical protein
MTEFLGINQLAQEVADDKIIIGVAKSLAGVVE